MTRRPLPTLLLVVSLAVGACGGAAGPTPSGTPATATPSPPATPAPTESRATPQRTPRSTSTPRTSTPPTDPPAFDSALYPYALQLPAGVLTRQWKPAAVRWDGVARIGTESPSVDITSTVNGILLIFGLPWDADLASFGQLVRDNAARFNGCTEVGGLRQVEVDGVAGVTQRQTCALGTQALYLVLVRDGYGMGFRMRDFLDPEAAVDGLVTWLGDGLTWELP